MRIQRKLLIIFIGFIFTNFAFAEPTGADKAKHKKPPKEAIEACLGKEEGDAVKFTTPRGDELSAICRKFKAPKLIAVPVRH